MPAAADRDDVPLVSNEVAALLKTIGAYRRDNARLQAELSELKRQDNDEPRPWKSLIQPGAEHEAARRALRAGKLQAERKGGRLYLTAKAVAAWRRIAGR